MVLGGSRCNLSEVLLSRVLLIIQAKFIDFRSTPSHFPVRSFAVDNRLVK